MRRFTANWSALSLVACGALAACTGTIGGPRGAAGGADGAGGVSAGNPNPSGAAGTTVLPGPTGGANNTFIDQDSTALARLTNVEYSQTVVDLLGEAPDAATRYQFPDDPRQHGFDNNTALLEVSSTHGDRYATAAATIAAATFSDPTRKARALPCDPAASGCLQTFVQTMGRRLYRRPLAVDEVAGFVMLASSTAVAGDPLSGPRTVLEAMLQSPYFLYKVQVGVADPKRPGLVGLSGFEIATRLSYLLLGTSPDDALLDEAQAGTLDTFAGVSSAAQAMLADPRARKGVRRFYEQWLPLTMVSGPTADSERQPHMGDAQYAADLVEETSRFVDDVLWDSGGKVPDILTASYTFVNTNLAKTYGVAAPAAGVWQKATFPASAQRSGVLTQGTILAAGSHGDKPSSTRRGQFVREQLLCTDVPSPPPGVNANVPPAMGAETEQQTFARHTTDASCASCHTLMDPIGWGLSGFASDGAARTKDNNGQPVSTHGLVNGMTPPDFSGPVELGQKLAASPEFKACFAKQLFRYAYARVETTNDAVGITELQSGFESGGWNLAKGLAALVLSDGFRYRNKGDEP
ncbi:MAG TPA: DUF1592 domain-containing protein [Polyangia bacterium]|nr:DUF1592 domain-containing protein [Polyangia bacterium]